MATAPLENSMVEKFLPEQQSADEWKRQSSKVPIGRWMFGFWMIFMEEIELDGRVIVVEEG